MVKNKINIKQKNTIAIQRDNAVSLLGTLPVDTDADEFVDAI